MERLIRWDFSAIRLWEHAVGRTLRTWVKLKKFFYVIAILGRAVLDLTTWNELGTTTNTLGSATFTDETAPPSAQKFYRASPLP